MAPPSTPGLGWSHGVLRTAKFALPELVHGALEEGRRPEIKKPLGLGFELSDLREPVLCTPRPPTRAETEWWHVDTYDALVTHDTYLLMAEHAVRVGAKDRVAREHHERCKFWRRALAHFLRQGLELRTGSQLGRGDERVFIHLAARAGGCPNGIRVCEWCLLVFEQPRANRCNACGDKGRFTPQARHETTVMFGHGDHRELQYVGVCQEPGCSARFQSGNTQTLYCSKHADNAAYQARHRRRKAA